MTTGARSCISGRSSSEVAVSQAAVYLPFLGEKRDRGAYPLLCMRPMTPEVCFGLRL